MLLWSIVAYPQVDGNNQGGGDHTAECLVPGYVDSAWLDGLMEYSVWNEEQDKRCEDALGNTQYENLLVEEKVKMTWSVETRIA